MKMVILQNSYLQYLITAIFTGAMQVAELILTFSYDFLFFYQKILNRKSTLNGIQNALFESQTPTKFLNQINSLINIKKRRKEQILSLVIV